MSKAYKMGDHHILYYGRYGEELGSDIAESLYKAQKLSSKHDKQVFGYHSIILKCITNTKHVFTGNYE